MWFDERLAALRPQPTATLAPDLARALGASAGDFLDVMADTRTLAGLVAVVSDDAAPGTVTVVDGLPTAPANAFVDGETVTIALRRVDLAVGVL
ncbi:MAG: hypothetical protein NVS1B2_10110 [Vulcanimicrobiaceae bacterium]